MAKAPRPKTERATSPKPAVGSPLAEYREKRDFEHTPEPRGESSRVAAAQGKESAAGPGVFVIQRHHARRLHYDVRLQVGGVMMSWAVPKGPSYDPAVKRLAVHVEDHPIAYNEFEGEIPRGNYGAGEVVIWDRGTWETVPPGALESMRAKGHLHVRLFGEKLQGEWHLIRTGEPQWIFRKADDRFADAARDIVVERPESVRANADRGAAELLSMIPDVARATIPKSEPRGPGWTFEIKYDGYRILAAKARGEVRLRSRNANDYTARFPSVVRALEELAAREIVLDGEVCAIDERGVSSFEMLQEWIAGQTKGFPQSQHLAYAVFDVLWIDGRDVRRRPIEERRAILAEALAGARPPIALSRALDGEAAVLLRVCREGGLEGLLAKKKGSPYATGHTTDWLKLKIGLRQEFAVIGYVPIEGTRVAGALVLAFVGDDGRFRFAGKVGTGFSDRQRRELAERLDAETIPDAPVDDVSEEVRRDPVRWVTPRLVVEVRFSTWLRSNSIRAASFVGIRPDKRADECRREGPPRPPKPVGDDDEAPAPDSARESRPHSTTHAAVDPFLLRGDPPLPTAPRAQVAAVTNPTKVLYPNDGITKRDVIDYLTAVAPVLLPHLAGRPITFQRWPDGIHDKQWFQHHPPDKTPDFVRRISVKAPDARGGRRPLVTVDNLQTLRWLGNLAALTIHSWSSHIPRAVTSEEEALEALQHPDYVVLDLDPGDGTWAQLVEVAFAVRRLLDALELPSVLKTSGKRGLHVVVPIARGPTGDEVTGFAEGVATAVAKVLPHLATTERMKDKRGGRLYLDYGQTGVGRTIVAPYTLRALDRAPVSTPLHWSELTPTLDATSLNLRTALARIDKHGDLFAPALRGTSRLPRVVR